MSTGTYNNLTGYHNRRSIRLPGYDYSSPGYYFVTVCIHDRKQLFFGNAVDNRIILNDYGFIVHNEILKTAKNRPNVIIDDHVIMPNHVHMIVALRGNPVGAYTTVGAYCNTPLPGDTPIHNTCEKTNASFLSPSKTIGAVVRGIKSTTTKQINTIRGNPGMPVWQRNYYEHIIRDKKSLYSIRKYIRENPANWFKDGNNHLTKETQILALSY